MVRELFSPDLARSAGIDQHRFPQNEAEAEAAELALEKELDRLSLNQHEEILFDVHGFAEVPGEDPTFVESKLRDLDSEISLIKTKPEYERARCLNKTYVESRALRLMVLRRESFRVRDAAELLVMHFKVKRELFGDEEVLAREVRLSDLSAPVQAILDDGFLQVLSTQDVSGRMVMCLRPLPGVQTDDGGISLEDMNRAVWYFHMILLRDEELQKKGLVMVVFNFKGWTADMEFVKKIHGVKNGIPTRLAGIHYCYNDASLKPFVSGLQLFLEKSSRLRVRQHQGSVTEGLFQLQTFGIPVEQCPMQKDESWSVSRHLEWLRCQRVRETKEVELMETLGTIFPRRFDVLFGKSKSAREHTGNMRLLHLCEMNQEAYECANKYEKTEIAERLLSIVHESNGRFLKWSDSGWEEVEDPEARGKIAHFFRHMRSKNVKSVSEPRKASKRPTPSSSPSLDVG